MTNLVLVEHDNAALKSATLHVIPAAQKIGGDIHLLVAGHNCRAVAEEAAKIPGVAKVLLADDAAQPNRLAESLAKLIVSLAPNYSHVLAPTTATGKNVMPRAAALLDVQQISDIRAVDSADTFTRTIYPGNELS